jgi:hypothetical protein
MLAVTVDLQARESLEAREKLRWSELIFEFFVEADLPVVDVVRGFSDSSRSMSRIFGSLRARTLRARARTWSRVRAWLLLVKGRPYPRGPSDMIDFLESIVCDKKVSVPDSVAAALFFVEKIGEVSVDSRISLSTSWMAAVKSIKSELQSAHGVSTKRAQAPTVALLLSWELCVADLSQPLCWRVMSFIRLMKCWACLRFDDVQGLDPDSFRLNDFCLKATLRRSKTTGPGKKTLSVPIFISRACSLTGLDWLTPGVQSLDWMVLRSPLACDLRPPRASGPCQATLEVDHGLVLQHEL